MMSIGNPRGDAREGVLRRPHGGRLQTEGRAILLEPASVRPVPTVVVPRARTERQIIPRSHPAGPLLSSCRPARASLGIGRGGLGGGCRLPAGWETRPLRLLGRSLPGPGGSGAGPEFPDSRAGPDSLHFTANPRPIAPEDLAPGWAPEEAPRRGAHPTL